MKRYLIWAGLLFAALLACGDDPSVTTVSGTIHGEGLRAPQAIYRVETGGSGLYKDDVYIIVSDVPDLCSAASTGTVPGLHLYFEAGFYVYEREVDPTRRTSTTPTNEANRFKDAEAVWRSSTGAEALAQHGMVRVDSYDDDGPDARGSFDLVFPNGERLTGDFSATWCTNLHTAAQNCTCGAAGAGGYSFFGLLALWAALRKARPGRSRSRL
ncbi:MAG: hypothetical protein HY901_18075 [Deltaproteobacteria bacterium]|nr:hypothetical protein [Deltaproteobacteria bacterium]